MYFDATLLLSSLLFIRSRLSGLECGFATQKMHSAMIISVLCSYWAVWGATAQQGQGLRLERNCFLPRSYGYVLPSSDCTCSKVNLQAEGYVEWTRSDGTTLPQVQENLATVSTVQVQSSEKYARSVTYVCRLLNAEGQKIDQLTHTVGLLFGPESPRLLGGEGSIHLCRNQSRDLTLYCEVPASTVNAEPVFNVAVDGRRYGSYDKLPGTLAEVEGNKVFRLAINFRVTEPGPHQVTCSVSNLYAGLNWSQLTREVQVLERAPETETC